jgi:hypothetical protein
MKVSFTSVVILPLISLWLVSCGSQPRQQSDFPASSESIWSLLDSTTLASEVWEFFNDPKGVYELASVYVAETTVEPQVVGARGIRIIGIASKPGNAKRYFAFLRDSSGSLTRFYDSGFVQEECGTPDLMVHKCSFIKLRDVSLILLEEEYRTGVCGAASSSDSVMVLVFDLSPPIPRKVLRFEVRHSSVSDDEGGINGTPYIRSTAYITGGPEGSTEISQIITYTTDSRIQVAPAIVRYQWDRTSNTFEHN